MNYAANSSDSGLAAMLHLRNELVSFFDEGGFVVWRENTKTGAVMILVRLGPGAPQLLYIVQKDGTVLCQKYWNEDDERDIEWVVMRTGEPCIIVDEWPEPSGLAPTERW